MGFWREVKVYCRKAKENVGWIFLFLGVGLVFCAIFLLFGVTCFSDSGQTRLSHFLCSLFEAKEKSVLIGYFGFVSMGFLTAIGLSVAARRSDALQGTADAQLEEVKGSKERRLQDRFKDGVGHLGSSSESVRVGGAYTLFQIALDLDEEDSLYPMRGVIVDLLCGHMRALTGPLVYRDNPENQKAPSPEVRSLVKMMFMTERGSCDSETEFDGKSPVERLNLSRRIDLTGVWLPGLNFADSAGFLCFRDVDLGDACFRKASVLGGRFDRAYLVKADFEGAILLDSMFRGAQIASSNFRESYIQAANFQGVVGFGADFGADSSVDDKFMVERVLRADFRGSIMAGSKFENVSVENVLFQGVRSLSSCGRIGFRNQDQKIEVRKSFSDRVIERAGKDWEFAGFHVLPVGGFACEDGPDGQYTEKEARNWVSECEKTGFLNERNMKNKSGGM